MSSPKNPGGQPPALPPLTDPRKIEDVFANHLVGINVRDGVVHLTFSHIRPKHMNPGSPSDDENIVVGRISFPVPIMGVLVDGYGQLTAAMQFQSVGKPN